MIIKSIYLANLTPQLIGLDFSVTPAEEMSAQKIWEQKAEEYATKDNKVIVKPDVMYPRIYNGVSRSSVVVSPFKDNSISQYDDHDLGCMYVFKFLEMFMYSPHIKKNNYGDYIQVMKSFLRTDFDQKEEMNGIVKFEIEYYITEVSFNLIKYTLFLNVDSFQILNQIEQHINEEGQVIDRISLGNQSVNSSYGDYYSDKRLPFSFLFDYITSTFDYSKQALEYISQSKNVFDVNFCLNNDFLFHASNVIKEFCLFAESKDQFLLTWFKKTVEWYLQRSSQRLVFDSIEIERESSVDVDIDADSYGDDEGFYYENYIVSDLIFLDENKNKITSLKEILLKDSVSFNKIIFAMNLSINVLERKNTILVIPNLQEIFSTMHDLTILFSQINSGVFPEYTQLICFFDNKRNDGSKILGSLTHGETIVQLNLPFIKTVNNSPKAKLLLK
jgi:hypothetical protein